METPAFRSILLWYNRKYNPKDTAQLLGRWMWPGSFSFIVGTVNESTTEGMASMNHLVILDAQAGELEKILSGTKSMVLKEFDPARPASHTISPGDSLYFLRNKAESSLRVKAAVLRVLFFTNHTDDDLSHILKEMQPRLQLTEDQYNYWSAKGQVLLVEFDSAHKTSLIQVAVDKIKDESDWIAFEELSLITDSG